VLGEGTDNGVWGKSTGTEGFSGVFGESTGGPGVAVTSISSVGVDAKSARGAAALRAVHSGAGGAGVLGVSKANGVHGKSTGDGRGSAGVFGEAIDGPGVMGMSQGSVGVDARSDEWSGSATCPSCGVRRTNVGSLIQGHSVRNFIMAGLNA